MEQGLFVTVVDARGSGSVFELSGDDIKLEGFNVINSGCGNYWGSAGIYVSSDNNIVTNNTIQNNCAFGILINSSNNNTLSNNLVNDSLAIIHSNYSTVESNTVNAFMGIESRHSNNSKIINNVITPVNHGITIFGSSDNEIQGNIINGIPGWTANEILGSSNITVKDNNFINTGLSVYSDQNIVINNTVNGKPLVYFENISDQIVIFAGQVVAVNCNVSFTLSYISPCSFKPL